MDIVDLPTELIYVIARYLDPNTLIAFSQTCKKLHAIVFSTPAVSDHLWRNLTQSEYTVLPQSTARNSGWLEIYKGLIRSEAYLWGQLTFGRMCIDRAHFLGFNRPHGSFRDGLTIPTRLTQFSKGSVSQLSTGGWAFHAVTKKGIVYYWGCMDGEQVFINVPKIHPGAVVDSPVRLDALHDLVPSVTHVDSGRKHAVAQGIDGNVYEWYAWGRVYRVDDILHRWGPRTGNGVVSINAGWLHSCILTQDGSVFLWRKFSGSVVGRQFIQRDAERGHSLQSREPVIGAKTVKLPSIAEERIVQIASGDDFILALTSSNKVFILELHVPASVVGALSVNEASTDYVPWEQGTSSINIADPQRALELAIELGDVSWRYLPQFCDVERMPASLQRNGPIVMNHISAHFSSFAVYSVGTDSSVVLLGKKPEFEPVVIPELQSRGVIKVVQGDYHWGALTKDGVLLTWGEFSAGALGLGNPEVPDTVLSTRNARDLRVSRPTPVIFVPQDKSRNAADPNSPGFFVTDVAMSGWQSGAIGFQIGQEPAASDDESDLNNDMPGQYPSPGSWTGGRLRSAFSSFMARRPRQFGRYGA